MKKGELTGEILRDWERLKRINDNMRAAYEGRDLLSEIEKFRKDRDEWQRIAVAAQLPKKRSTRSGGVDR